MIEFSRMVLVGRTEPVTEDTRWVREVADLHTDRAQRIFEWRWPDKVEAWDQWNVQALMGRFGRWSEVEFQRWEGLGRRAVVVLRESLRYQPTVDRVDPVTISRVNPPVLHRTWKLLPPSGKPHVPPGAAPPKRRAGWIDRLRALEIKLDRRGLLDHPDSGKLRDWERLLKREGIRVEQDSYGRFSVVEISDREPFKEAS